MHVWVCVCAFIHVCVRVYMHACVCVLGVNTACRVGLTDGEMGRSGGLDRALNARPQAGQGSWGMAGRPIS